MSDAFAGQGKVAVDAVRAVCCFRRLRLVSIMRRGGLVRSVRSSVGWEERISPEASFE